MSKFNLRLFQCGKCKRFFPILVGEDLEPTSNYCWNCEKKAWEGYRKNPENLEKELQQESRYDEYLQEEEGNKRQKIMKEKGLQNKNEYRAYINGYWNGYFMGITRGRAT